VKQLKNILFLQFLFVALFFFFFEKQAPEAVSNSELPISEYAQQGFGSVAFLQPEAAHHVVSTVKTFSFFVARLSDFLETDFTNSIQLNIRKAFLNQDIDRCETVSLLLFPYHFFW